ncbi:MAG: hypothetical protein HXX09_04010 [Bacteroidetes bacterium]|nr:hypothetical protein [Bacteroidota bacterium]
MMKKLLFGAVILGVTMMYSCSGTSTKDKTTSDSTNVKKDESKETPKGKYQIKSGIISITSEAMGFKTDVVSYFDNYGAQETSVSTMDIMGMKTERLSINKDGFIWDIDMKTKTGTKMKIPEKDPKNIDFTGLTEGLMKEMNIKKEGTETLLGKTCDKFSMNYEKMKTKANYSVWKGIALKTEMDMMGMKVKMIATKLEENATIAADKFEVPAGVKIKDIK